jgi:hypothetical protein
MDVAHQPRPQRHNGQIVSCGAVPQGHEDLLGHCHRTWRPAQPGGHGIDNTAVSPSHLPQRLPVTPSNPHHQLQGAPDVEHQVVTAAQDRRRRYQQPPPNSCARRSSTSTPVAEKVRDTPNQQRPKTDQGRQTAPCRPLGPASGEALGRSTAEATAPSRFVLVVFLSVPRTVFKPIQWKPAGPGRRHPGAFPVDPDPSSSKGRGGGRATFSVQDPRITGTSEVVGVSLCVLCRNFNQWRRRRMTPGGG